MISPGMKVAVRVPMAPHCLALGIVTADGEHVVWHEIIDMSDGSTSNKYGMGFRFGKTPKPIKGDEVPCPPGLAHLLPDPNETDNA
jgi:hypothetical protein